MISAYITFQLSSKFFLYGYYTTVSVNTSSEVEALKQMREGNSKIAMQILESNIKSNASSLEFSSNEIPASAKQITRQALSSVKKYTEVYAAGSEE